MGPVLPKTHYFLWVFHFLKPYSSNHPTQPTFLGGFDIFFGFTQPMYTPTFKFINPISHEREYLQHNVF